MTYIKDSVSNKDYLEIKSGLNKLDSLEETKLENFKLKNEIKENLREKMKLENEINNSLKINQELDNCKKQLILVKGELEKSFCYRIRKYLKLKSK